LCSSRIGPARRRARPAGLDQVAQFQQAHAQPVAAGLRAVDEAADGQVVQDAVGGGRVQPVRSLMSFSDTGSWREASTSSSENMRSMMDLDGSPILGPAKFYLMKSQGLVRAR
jgi:hypothetical protein